MPELKKVEVIWDDAWSESAELTMEAIQNLKPVTRYNIGYLLKGTENEVILAAGVAEKLAEGQDTFSDVLVIPRGMVKEIKVLNV